MKRFISGLIAGILLTSGIAMAATYIAEPATFKILLNGEEFNPDPQAMVIDGATYLPLKAVGDSLGVAVNWNEELQQVEIVETQAAENDLENNGSMAESEILTTSTDMFYKENENIPNFGMATIYTDAVKKTIDGDMIFYFYDVPSNSTLDGMISLYKIWLESGGFYCSEKNNVYSAINKNNLSMVVFGDVNGQIVVGFRLKQ